MPDSRACQEFRHFRRRSGRRARPWRQLAYLLRRGSSKDQSCPGWRIRILGKTPCWRSARGRPEAGSLAATSHRRMCTQAIRIAPLLATSLSPNRTSWNLDPATSVSSDVSARTSRFAAVPRNGSCWATGPLATSCRAGRRWPFPVERASGLTFRAGAAADVDLPLRVRRRPCLRVARPAR